MSQKPKSSEKHHKTSRLEGIRKTLTPLQKKLLNEFWEYFKKHSKWPVARSVHSQHGKQAVKECLKGLGGDIVSENRGSSPGTIYELSIIGILLTDMGADYFSMLTKYLEFLRTKYQEAPDQLTFSDKDFREGLGLSDEQVKILGGLVRLDGLWSGGGYGPSSWNIHVPDEVEDFPENGPLEQALEDILFRRFRENIPVSIEERQRQQVQTPAVFVGNYLSGEMGIPIAKAPVTIDALKRRYQVFVSSTYEDLKEERQHVIQALLETKCIPLGMELFPAASVEQWELIKRVIDECDYYLVVIAGRYGSLSQSKVGYTEMEFDYAMRIGKPVIGFYHKSPEELPGTKTEKTDDGRKRMKSFTEKVKKKLCRPWGSAAELGSAVKSAILNELEFNPKPGWIRADAVPSSDSVDKLKQKIANLEERLKKRKPSTTSSFPEGAESVFLTVIVHHDFVKNDWEEREARQQFEIKHSLTWDKLLLLIRGELLKESNTENIGIALASQLAKTLSAEIIKAIGTKTSEFECSVAFNKTDVILKTLTARKLVTTRVVKDFYEQIVFWKITPKGLQYLAELEAVRSST